MSQPNFETVERKCCQTELIHKFILTLRSHTLGNIMETLQNVYHVDLHFT